MTLETAKTILSTRRFDVCAREDSVADSLPIRAVKTHSHLVKMRHLNVIPVTASEGNIAAWW
jgi:hypothetical protein